MVKQPTQREECTALLAALVLHIALCYHTYIGAAMQQLLVLV